MKRLLSPPVAPRAFLALLCACALATPAAAEYGEDADGDASPLSWTFTRELSEAPRGGTTVGPDVSRDESVPPSWEALRAPGLSKRERDRRAILALQGEYKVEFEFIETFAIDPSATLDRPYSSWATEYVDVVEERDDFLSLQHLMVMYFVDPESGETVGPHVMKHWRQDWTWNASRMWEYRGDDTWASRALEPDESDGRWLWEVYQVDDSPRYAGLGEWDHFESVSTFSTDQMTRPLPRREHSVRDDYRILTGEETLLVTPTAWFHEQRNFKRVESIADGDPIGAGTFLSREIGHNSYERIEGFDFEAGHRYWEETEGYWADVRAVWRELLHERETIELTETVDGTPLFARHFEQADDPVVQRMDRSARRALIRRTILEHVA